MPTTYHVTDIRNVALAGHGASGKTSLADALLFASGATTRKGSVDDGTSTLDIDEEEKRRHFTIDCHLGHLAWTGKQVHLIDTPGYPDFIGNALGALAAVENVVVAVSGPSGIEVNTRRLFQEAGRLGLGRFIVVTKMDADNVDYRSDLAAIRETFGTFCVPFNVPVGQGSTFSGRDRRDPVARRRPRGLPAGADRGLSHGRRADRRARRRPDDALPRGRDGRARRAAPGRSRRDRPGQAGAGALRVHPQGPRPPRAARPDLHLRPEPGRHPSLRHSRAPRPTHPRKRSCPPRRERWSPRSSRRSTISSWESSATCAS